MLALFVFPHLLNAQVTDDFSDGDFTQNPTWTGTESYFKVNDNKQLQLNDNEEREAFLSTPNAMALNTEWRFWVKLSFSPSSNNNARIYLVSNQQDITQPLNGYFLQLGESGSNDAIELFRQSGNDLQSVCRGTEGLIASSFTLRIKVIRDAQGNWKVFADPTGGENFTPQGEGSDNTFTSTAYIGFYCKYTVSNSTKFYFDEVYTGEIIVDNTPPVLLSVVPDSENTLKLQFDETVSKESVETLTNYQLNQGFGNPDQASLDASDPTIVHLKFSGTFGNGQSYLLAVSNVEDLSGNAMQPVEMPFTFYHPQPFDVVINEIMADPTPSVGLPEYEYLELFNQTDNIIDLSGWTLTIGSSEKLFEKVVIAPNGYLILAKNEAEALLGIYGPFYGFSSFSLTNSGQSLVLRDKEGVLISSVNYTDTWYNNPDKEEGGWSLEQINPENVCSGRENWTASNDIKGGSPGAENSVRSEVVFLPALSRFEMPDNNTLQLFFTQKMDAEKLGGKTAYSVDQSVGNPASVLAFEEEPEKVELLFENEFEAGIIFQLTISKQLQNCLGLEMTADTTVSFGIPASAGSNDILINEVLFNPWTNGVDYVEIYNHSDKVIDLKSLQLGTVKNTPPNPPDTSFYTISDIQSLFIPGDYLLLTSSPEAVKKQYSTTNPDGFLKVDPFPSYNNDDGTVLLVSASQIIDAFNYSEDMHYPLLNYVDGVSLERTRFDSPTQDETNWHSAAESAGFGTPAFQNSQFIPPENSDEEIVLIPEIFSPDNDGYDDIIGIHYQFAQPGYVMTVQIFDANGQAARQLVNNEYLGTSGVINWDGIRDDNSKAPVGIYVFYIEVFDLDGNVKKYKKVGVLATKL
ncbi:MAG: lamin tail domain-containing protein [Bacteroidales bacterium]|nr:lamin tail domain-containing protein [Bacteroidales bacterium]